MTYSPLGILASFQLEHRVLWKFGGGSKQQTQTTERKLTSEQQALQSGALKHLQPFINGEVPSLPAFSLIAGFDPLQTQGQQAVLGATEAQQALASQGAVTSQFLSGDVLNPESNPALQGAINAAVNPIYDNLTETVLPQIRGEAATVGQFGGSRQGVAEGIASQGASRAAGEASSRIANQNYQSGLDALQRNLALLPQTQAAQLTPGLTTSGVGDIRQQLSQALLGEQGSNFSFEQLAPLLIGKELAGISAGLPGGSTVSTANSPQADPFSQILGLGATALGTFGNPFGSLSSLLGGGGPRFGPYGGGS